MVTGDLNVCSLCALFTNSVGICVPSRQSMTDCPSIARSRAGQTWLSAGFDSISSCHINFSDCQPMSHRLLNPFCKAIVLWPPQASHTSKGNETVCGDVFLIAFVAALLDRQIWTYSLNNQMYCIAGLISCLYLSVFSARRANGIFSISVCGIIFSCLSLLDFHKL